VSSAYRAGRTGLNPHGAHYGACHGNIKKKTGRKGRIREEALP